MTTVHCIGWDIGGAHLKMVHLDRNGEVITAIQKPTPIWQGDDILPATMQSLLTAHIPERAQHCITLTAELADCYPDRIHGVQRIISLISTCLPDTATQYYSPQGMLAPAQAKNQAQSIMSYNWHATATAASQLDSQGILIDIGSTTSDIIPFIQGVVSNLGSTDQERLCSGELLYTGIARTPVMALCKRVPFAGLWQTLANEIFATTADIYRICGELDEMDDQHPASDGADKSVAASRQRLARMLGGDYDEKRITESSVTVLAQYLADTQLQLLQQAVAMIISRHPVLQQASLVGTGCGTFLSRRLAMRLNMHWQDFALLAMKETKDGTAINRCAAAYAVARLQQQCHNAP